jgi:hypothetical protein
MTHRSFIQSSAFEPEEIAAMSEALEAALKELHDIGQFVVRASRSLRDGAGGFLPGVLLGCLGMREHYL